MKKKEYKKRIEKEKRQLRKLEEKSIDGNLKTGLIITLCVIAFVLLMFIFTKVKTGEWNLFTKENNITYSAEIGTTKVLCGSVLNRIDEEYFVLAYNMSDDEAMLYESILDKYSSSSDVLPFYKLDLSNSRNGICTSDNINISNDINELKVNNPTLLKIKNGKIINYYTTYDSIKNILLSYIG